MKPFVKWVGGKTQHIDLLKTILPNHFDSYIEPFAGGAALMYQIKPKNVILNDINFELIKSFNTIKNSNLDDLFKVLDLYENNNSKEYFLEQRSTDVKKLTDVEITARFIYLNKAGFNGLYRVNSKGVFNVPYNNKKDLKIYNKDNLVEINKYLNSINFKALNEDYKKIINNSKKGDFLFVDPPYDYEEAESGFTSYSKSGFNSKDQEELFNALNKANDRGVKWILCNHDTKLINNLYNKYNKVEKISNRFINSDATKRKNARIEVFYYNYSNKKENEIEESQKTKSFNWRLFRIFKWK